MARAYLEGKGWLIADRETSGLAGDDLFAQDPDGTWWSIECKNVQSLQPAHRNQAISQAAEREKALTEALRDPRSLASRLGITFDKRNWLLMWKPSNYNNGTDFIVMRADGRKTKYEIWE